MRPRGRDVARRLPTGDEAMARWRHIWQATKHLESATAEQELADRVPAADTGLETQREPGDQDV